MDLLSFQFLRFVANGLAATAVHFSVLVFCIEVAGLPSAAVSNGVAAIFGISASFIGNRYFVFPNARHHLTTQILRFSGLYAAIAVFHGLALFVWSDWLGFDYRIGFVLATSAQLFASYLLSKRFVFG